LRKQVLITACLAALAITAGVFYGARQVLFHSFATIESEQAKLSIERVRKALESDIDQLDSTTADYALWNDAHDFLQGLGNGPGFIASNFTSETLNTLRVQLVWITDVDGQTVVGLTSRDASGGLKPIPADVMAVLQSDAPLLVAQGSSPAAPLRLVRTPSGILAFAALHVLRTDRTGPSAGTLVFGRYLDGAVVARVAQTSQSLVHLTLLDDKGQPTSDVPQIVADWLGGPSDDVLVQADGSRTLGSYTLLRDIEGRPLAVLSTSATRDALMLGEQTITYVVAGLLFCFAVMVTLLLTLLNRGLRTQAAAQREWLDQQRKLSRVARRDVLTGLPNRLHLQKLLPRLLSRASRDGTRLALLYMDLDNFKNINDSLGHGSGDKLLTTLARRLRASVAAHDVVIRMGGDEFVVIATLLPEADVVNTIADRIQSVLQVPLDLDGVTLSITPSIGISVYPEDGTDPEQLLKHADIALYHAKDQGRGNHQFYTPEMNTRLRERLELERALKQALENKELYIEYQPCFELPTLRPVSLEALIRWRTASGELIPPSRFIPVAEQSGLIVQIGDWVLRRVCEQLAEWQRTHVPLVPVSVNISVRQLEHTQLAAAVSKLAHETGIDANLLHFEITESVAMQNSQQYMGALQALRNLGSRILIDDFGTGYSSLSYLKHLPIDTLKIDRAFVRDMAQDTNDAAIVRAIAAVAKSLGLQLVAEGIESAEQLECLRKLDCECGQGFYLSPPVSAELCRGILWQLRGPRSSAEPPKLRLLNPG
jgi:diguanylate cyclase (GGDEF)-like protein